MKEPLFSYRPNVYWKFDMIRIQLVHFTTRGERVVKLRPYPWQPPRWTYAVEIEFDWLLWQDGFTVRTRSALLLRCLRRWLNTIYLWLGYWNFFAYLTFVLNVCAPVESTESTELFLIVHISLLFSWLTTEFLSSSRRRSRKRHTRRWLLI